MSDDYSAELPALTHADRCIYCGAIEHPHREDCAWLLQQTQLKELVPQRSLPPSAEAPLPATSLPPAASTFCHSIDADGTVRSIDTDCYHVSAVLRDHRTQFGRGGILSMAVPLSEATRAMMKPGMVVQVQLRITVPK